MQNFQGGRWRYKFVASVQYIQSPIQRCKMTRVDAVVTNFQCSRYIHSLQYKDAKFLGWTLALQTYSVREIDRVYNRRRQNFKGGPVLHTYSVREIYTVHNTRMQKIKGGRWRYKLLLPVTFTVYTQDTARINISRVDVGITDL